MSFHFPFVRFSEFGNFVITLISTLNVKSNNNNKTIPIESRYCFIVIITLIKQNVDIQFSAYDAFLE